MILSELSFFFLFGHRYFSLKIFVMLFCQKICFSAYVYIIILTNFIMMVEMTNDEKEVDNWLYLIKKRARKEETMKNSSNKQELHSA